MKTLNDYFLISICFAFLFSGGLTASAKTGDVAIRAEIHRTVFLSDTLPNLSLGPDQTICRGDSVVLSFNWDSTRWFDGSVRRSITVRNAGLYWGSYFDSCCSKSDTIAVFVVDRPVLDLGPDILLCGDEPGTLISNYDNTIWSNGAGGRMIQVTTPGRLVGFVSTACGVDFDTVEVRQFPRSALHGGEDKETCDDEVQLMASFNNPYPQLFTSTIKWVQLDTLPAVSFSDPGILAPTVGNLTKDKFHLFEFRISLGGLCTLTDTVRVRSKTCFIDSCGFLIKEECLPNGMVQLSALDANGLLIRPKALQRELFWNIQDGPAQSAYSLLNVNPIATSNYTRYRLTSKIYSWKPGYPKTREYADLCVEQTSDSLELHCPGPCEDFSFILSSCEDDYDVTHQLEFPDEICQSVCSNPCQYIVGVFDLQGRILDPNQYSVKWSTGETDVISLQNGCYNYHLSVEVRRGDCIWKGRYREQCELHTGSVTGQTAMSRSRWMQPIPETLEEILQSGTPFEIRNLMGQKLGNGQEILNQLSAGIYLMGIGPSDRKHYRKVFIDGTVRNFRP
ncbi:MAG TPA: hypothetical protein VFX48_00645 [Saprospiraceae bacterium]|nr:hypothetical protein [Saprospiraceae bacterium]